MTDDESVKDLLSSFKDKENTPEGRGEILQLLGWLMTDDESVEKIKRIRHWGVGKFAISDV